MKNLPKIVPIKNCPPGHIYFVPDELTQVLIHGYPVIAPDARCVTMTRDKSGKLVFGRSLPYGQNNNASKNRK